MNFDYCPACAHRLRVTATYSRSVQLTCMKDPKHRFNIVSRKRKSKEPSK